MFTEDAPVKRESGELYEVVSGVADGPIWMMTGEVPEVDMPTILTVILLTVVVNEKSIEVPDVEACGVPSVMPADKVPLVGNVIFVAPVVVSVSE